MKKFALLIMALIAFVAAVPVYAQTFEDSAINIIGINDALATSLVPIADSTEITLMTTAATVEVTSTSTDDGPGGTGILTLQIQGLDADWVPATETITMNGTTAAVSVNSYIRINKIAALTYGALGAASGEVSVGLSGSYFARILTGNTESYNGFYSVPKNKYAYINFVGASAVTQPVKFKLKVREFGGAFKNVDAFNLSGSDTTRELKYKVIANPKSDIVMYGAATSSTAAATANIQIKLKN